jgi:hypothetical protein
MRKITKRSIAIVAASAIAVGGGAAAWAMWTSTGTASVSATAGSAAPLGVSATSVTGTLVPGSKGNVLFTVTNDNNYPVQVNALSLGGFAADSLAACDAAATFQQAASATLPSSLSTPIAAHTSIPVTWNDAIELKADPDNDCQDQGFHFTVSMAAVSAAV